MAKIKPMPVHIREYYKAMKDAYIQKQEDARIEREELISQSYTLHDDILARNEAYLRRGINLLDYPEFINNEYSDGTFLKMCEVAYLNKSENFLITYDLNTLLKYARMQYRIYELKNTLDFCDRILKIKSSEYTRYMREFFTIVHKKMIIEGCAYGYGRQIGHVFINRVRATSGRKRIDYKATKEKKNEIIANGGRLYNKKEAEWCEKNGIKYNGEDGRVYLSNEYFYEIFLINQNFKEANTFNFSPQDYRAVEIRGKSNAQLIEECGRDINKICELPIDLKSKVYMCVEVDKMLYTNFIRNENQTSYKHPEANR